MSREASVPRPGTWVLYAAILYLPLEEFLLKWAPVGATGYAVLRLGFEALLGAALVAELAARRVRGLALPSTPLDLPLCAFVALALVSLASSGGSWLAGLVNLRVLLRYVLVFYLAVAAAPDACARRRALALVLAAGGLQGVLGLVQHLQGGPGEFWLPRADALEVGGVTKEFAVLTGGIEQGAVLGTTDHSVAFALFLLIVGTLAAALWFAGAARALPLAGLLCLALVGILFSYTRSCLFGLLLALALLAWFRRRSALLARVVPLAAVLAPLGLAGWLLLPGGGAATFAREKETAVDPLASVGALFTSEYVQTAQSSRLWVLGEVGGEIARTAGWLGLGPDEEHAKERLAQAGGAPLHRLIAYRAFEDVYWVALLAYYGFAGLALFALVLARLVPLARRARARAVERWDVALAEALLALLVVSVPLGFLAPTFDFRTFAFYFWLLAGLVAVVARESAGGAARAGASP